LNDHNHLVLKEDDVIGILETDDVKDMKPLNDRVLIKVVISYLFDSDVWLHSWCIGAFASIFSRVHSVVTSIQYASIGLPCCLTIIWFGSYFSF
jgi:hypothetical protein